MLSRLSIIYRLIWSQPLNCMWISHHTRSTNYTVKLVPHFSRCDIKTFSAFTQGNYNAKICTCCIETSSIERFDGIIILITQQMLLESLPVRFQLRNVAANRTRYLTLLVSFEAACFQCANREWREKTQLLNRTHWKSFHRLQNFNTRMPLQTIHATSSHAHLYSDNNFYC